MRRLAILGAVICMAACHTASSVNGDDYETADAKGRLNVQLGPRPFYLVDQMVDGPLKRRLQQCERRRPRPSEFSIGHRGAPLQFPEHTRESYVAAARMGAGILECDVTFTNDRELVCRHAQCDLHTTTNILATPLAAQCSEGFEPAVIDSVTGEVLEPASARCCTSDISLAQFRSLVGKMDASNPRAQTVEEYLGGTADFRTDLYTTGGTLLTHRESIELFKQLRVGFTPELKSPEVEMPFEGDYTQQEYAQQMIDEYKAAHVHPRHVWAQSFNLEDVLYWIDNEPRFGKQAVFLDDRVYTNPEFVPSASDFAALKDSGVNIVAPPMFALLALDAAEQMVPSDYALLARQQGLDIITWTTERSGRIVEDVLQAGGTFYYLTTLPALRNDGDIFTTLNVLARDVGVIGVFSDWPATTTFFANCMGL